MPTQSKMISYKSCIGTSLYTYYYQLFLYLGLGLMCVCMCILLFYLLILLGNPIQSRHEKGISFPERPIEKK